MARYTNSALYSKLPITRLAMTSNTLKHKQLLRGLVFVLSVTEAFCAFSQASDTHTDRTTVPASRACPPVSPVRLLLWFGVRELKPGTSLDLRVLHMKASHDYEEIPRECVSDWKSSVPALAQIDAKTGGGRIRADGADGSVLTVSAHVGPHAVSAPLRVVDAVRHPLMGTWRQTQEIICGNSRREKACTPIGELRFSAAGAFSLTRTPFERYIDYSGSYRFDEQQKTLALTISSGNRKPDINTFNAKAHLTEAGELQVAQLPDPAGDANPSGAPSACDMIFVRQ